MTARRMSACWHYPSIRDRLILLNGWSKTYAMTGWRLGYAIWPGKLYDYARKLAVNLHSCVNAPTQFAGIAALTGPQDAVAHMVAEFDKRRKMVVEGLNQLPGVSCIMPKGAFYAFPERQADRLEGQAAGHVAAGRLRRRADRRSGLRHPGRGLSARVLRQLDREHSEGARPHGRVLFEEGGNGSALTLSPPGGRRRAGEGVRHRQTRATSSRNVSRPHDAPSDDRRGTQTSVPAARPQTRWRKVSPPGAGSPLHRGLSSASAAS